MIRSHTKEKENRKHFKDLSREVTAPSLVIIEISDRQKIGSNDPY
jgi:hypothetical protein